MSTDNRDATPSWSGYIFQGEVALCKALERINSLESIPVDYYLKLEEDEDFSLKTTSVEVFQVKAYETKEAGQFSTYSEFIKELINRYYYSIENSSIYSLTPRKRPIKSILITSKGIGRSIDNFSKLERRFSSLTQDYFEIIHGVYTLDNIHSKLEGEIRKILSTNQRIDLNGQIDAIRDYCSFKIHKIIKKRHQSKIKERIDLNEIKDWVLNAPQVLDEDIFWHIVTKNIFTYFNKELKAYEEDTTQNAEYIKNIKTAIFELERLSILDTIKLFKEHLSPHKNLDMGNLGISLASFIDKVPIREIVLKAIKNINLKPDYKSLRYTRPDNIFRYQLTTHYDEYNFNDVADKIEFQKDCENIANSSFSLERTLFVTKNLNLHHDEVKSKLRNQTRPLEEEMESHNQVDPPISFGFIDITTTIQELNKE